jgi:transposase
MSKPKMKGRRRRGCRGKKATEALKPKHLNAAGLDIGSEVHYVAVPADRDEQPVRHFGCLTPELHEMARWLKQCGITTVAMESTGVYWVPVMEVLESWGFDTYLVDARNARNVPGRKTDVQDCQWLQELHSYGLLSRAFRPSSDVRVLRSYWRQRANLVELCSQQILRMQKALEQMNIQLHKVLSDITGLTGMKIIRAIVTGQRDPVALARMRHPQVKNSKETFVQALTGTYREEHLFALRQAVQLYDVFHAKISECDRQLEECLRQMEAKGNSAKSALKPTKRKHKPRKNEPRFDLRSELCRITGVDLTRIDGIDAMTAQTVISEQGFDMSAFPSEKDFASHLGLCPNHRITGGKIIKRKTRKVQSRAAKALRLAAQSLHHSKTALGAFYRRLRARLGPAKAITATAHKLARLIYRMLKYGETYVDVGQEYYEQQYRERVIKNLKRRARQMGYQLLEVKTGELVS